VKSIQIFVKQLLMPILDAELILNRDGSIYHLNLHPEQVAPTILTVGDPERVKMVSQYFDRIEHKVKKREFVTHTGYIGTKRLTVISTGIGTDNIDIVFNELDALFNIDLQQKIVQPVFTPLTFIRIGTSGCLRKDIPLDAFLVSAYAVGLDNLLHYYRLPQTVLSERLQEKIQTEFKVASNIALSPYVVEGSRPLIQALGKDMYQGITLTAPGFYGPQGRQLRAPVRQIDLIDVFQNIDLSAITPHLLTNLEMETAGIYGLAKVLGHQAISFNALLANRETGAFSTQAGKTVKKLIETVLERVVDY